MSVGADGPGRPELPREWERLERVAETAAAEVVFWRRRTSEAEEEVGRLRRRGVARAVSRAPWERGKLRAQPAPAGTTATCRPPHGAPPIPRSPVWDGHRRGEQGALGGPRTGEVIQAAA